MRDYLNENMNLLQAVEESSLDTTITLTDNSEPKLIVLNDKNTVDPKSHSEINIIPLSTPIAKKRKNIKE